MKGKIIVTKLMPRQPVPELEVSTLSGEAWNLTAQNPENFTMIVFYRGLHCPICSNYMRDLERKLEDFGARGVGVVAISSDDQDRAQQTKADWGLQDLTIGYGLSIEAARAWGLYVSSGVGKTSAGIEEPPLFNEPGLFLVRPDGTLYAATTATMPFARPHFAELLKALDVILGRNYPARGEA